MKKNTLKRFMASAMTAVMCVSSLGTLAVNAAPADPAAETSVVDNLMSRRRKKRNRLRRFWTR